MTQTDPAFLRRQLIETDRLAALHEKDAFMAMAWANRRESLLEELAEAEARNRSRDALLPMALREIAMSEEKT